MRCKRSPPQRTTGCGEGAEGKGTESEVRHDGKEDIRDKFSRARAKVIFSKRRSTDGQVSRRRRRIFMCKFIVAFASCTSTYETTEHAEHEIERFLISTNGSRAV